MDYTEKYIYSNSFALSGLYSAGSEYKRSYTLVRIVTLSFQPSEIAKLVIILTVSHMLFAAKKYNNLNTLNTLSSLLIIGVYVIGMGALIGVFRKTTILL
ncbi:hypothetical protein [Priestia filamentosa]|uniref:hypothetical protein n=1 Tax=Priestia filamentosa TaxID=1402861 RepID=UPI0039827475